MKRLILLAMTAFVLSAAISACAPSKTAGYVSKYPNHKRHPCDH